MVPSNSKLRRHAVHGRGDRNSPSRTRCLQIFKAILLSGLTLLPGYQCFAQEDTAKAGESLSIAPKDTEFYFGSYVGKKQLHAFLDGPVVTTFANLPVVQENWSEFKRAWDEPQGNLAMARFAWDSPVLQDVLKFSADLLSEEMFAYGTGGVGHWTNFINETFESVSQQISTDGEFSDEQQLKFLDIISAELHARDLPTLVFGGKFEYDYEAVSKVDQLEMLIGLGKQSAPEADAYLRKIKRIDDERGSRLVLEVSGAMVPWDLINQNDDLSDEVKSRAREVFENARFTLVVGMLDGYFVVATCPKIESLMNWKDGSHLVSHEHLKPALENAGKELTHLLYVSDEFAKSNFDSNFKNILSKNINVIVESIRNSEDLDEGQEQFFNDLQSQGERLNSKLMALIPPIFGSLQYGWLTANGSEYRVHNRTTNPFIDGSQKLELLGKLGGAPMLGVASKYLRHVGYEDFFADLAVTAKKLFFQLEELNWGDDEVENEDLKQARQVLELCWPTVEEIATIYSTRIAPSLTGEAAMATSSGNIKSKQWLKEMPEASQALPIYEIGFVLGLTDSDQFRLAVNDVRTKLNDLIGKLRKEFPNEIPEQLVIPTPESVESSLGAKFIYPIPDELAVPAGLVPQALYANDSFVLTYSDALTKSLATTSELAVGKGEIDPNANYANAAYIDVGALIGVLEPWSHYAAELAAEKQSVDQDENLIDTRASLGADLSLTINDLLSVWNAVKKAGKFTNTITVEESGESISRTVYTQSLP